MRVPFYSTYKEYEDNYDDDKKKFKTFYPDIPEDVYFSLFKKRYDFLNYDDLTQRDRISINYTNSFRNELKRIPISINHLVDLMNEITGHIHTDKVTLLNNLFDENDALENGCFIMRLLDPPKYAEFDFVGEKALIDKNDFEIYLSFLDIRDYSLKFNEIKYQNLLYTSARIFENKPETETTTEQPESDQLNLISQKQKKDIETKLTQKQVSYLGRLILDNFFKDNFFAPSQITISNCFSEIFGFSEISIQRDITGYDYKEKPTITDKKRLIVHLQKLINEIDKDIKKKK